MVPNPDEITSHPADIWLADGNALDLWHDGRNHVLAVDTEFVRERTYWPTLALVQLSGPGPTRLVDPLTFEPLARLGELLADPSSTVLMHSAGEDLVALRPLLPSPIIGLYDTQIAAAFAGLGPGLGYQACVAQLLDVHLEKQETRSNWLARPLSARQIDYALDDVRHLQRVHDLLDERLQARGFAGWHREDCRRLAENGYRADTDDQPQLAFRNGWRWSHEAQAQLRRILLWREQAARERDLPRRWVLDDDTAIAAAIEPDHSAARLAARLADAPAGRRRSLQSLLNLLERAPDADELAATIPVPAPHDDALKQTMKRLKAKVDAEAERLDLPPGLLCPRRALETLVRTSSWPAELGGWRREVLESALLAEL
jgi:ribonuclease D